MPYHPPKPVGEPFRADPNDPVPFPDEHESPRQLPTIAEPVPVTPDLGMPPVPNDGRAVRPQFRQPNAAGQAKPKRVMRAHEKAAKIALAVGIASLVISPVLGPIAIVLGAKAIKNGEKNIGWWAISAGIAGTVIGIVFAILVLTGVMPSFSELLDQYRNKQ